MGGGESWITILMAVNRDWINILMVVNHGSISVHDSLWWFATLSILIHESPPSLHWFTIRHHQYIDSRVATIHFSIDSRFTTIQILIHDSRFTTINLLIYYSPPPIYWFTIHHHQSTDWRFTTINILSQDPPPINSRLIHDMIRHYQYSIDSRFATISIMRIDPWFTTINILIHDLPPWTASRPQRPYSNG